MKNCMNITSMKVGFKLLGCFPLLIKDTLAWTASLPPVDTFARALCPKAGQPLGQARAQRKGILHTNLELEFENM